MSWRRIHRWAGLWLGALVVVIGLTGSLLAFFPLRDTVLATRADPGMPIAVLAQRVADRVPGIEEIQQLPAGDIVAYAFQGNRATAWRIDPADGRPVGAYQASSVERWVRNLHRSFLLGDAGRLLSAAIALLMMVLAASGAVLLARRLGGWRHLGGRVRGSVAQRVHGMSGRALVLLLALSSVTALYMSATTFNLLPADTAVDPDVVSAAGSQPDLHAADLPLLKALQVGGLRKLNFPSVDDAEDTWAVTTAQGAGWVDRRSGSTLAWVPATAPRQIYDWVYALHTGQGLWFWALLPGLAGLLLPAFWVSGLLIWKAGAGRIPRLRNNAAWRQADVLIFVASEGGTTWGFAQALHDAFVRAGHEVHSAPIEQFQVGEAARQVFILAATYGDGQAPAHAARALGRIASQPVRQVPVTVLGFGDRQFPAFCGYARALDDQLRGSGWPQTLPLECVHQQSAQQFATWARALSAAMGEALEPDYVPRVPHTTALELVARQDYPDGASGATVILRFCWDRHGWQDWLPGRGMARFEAGDLLGILPPGSAVPRFYSLASGYRDGFVEICVRRMPDGVCSGYLHGLAPGDRIQAFIKSNPGFTLDHTHRPVVLIGAGTGVAPLAGFVRGNTRRTPMFLYFGARDPAQDFYFGEALRRWQGDHRLAHLQTAFSRVPEGGGYVQDALRRDADRLRNLISRGALLRVCGSRAMAHGVAETLDGILHPAGQTVQGLRNEGRYAEDVF